MRGDTSALNLLKQAGTILEKHKEDGGLFNWLELLDLTRDERSHSRILAFLLDPYANHGQSDRFLRSFLEEIVRLPQSGNDLKTIRVRREDILSRFGRIDVSIVLPEQCIVLIENKVDWREGDDQISKYLQWLEQKPAKNGKHVLIFLTPDGREPKTGHETTSVKTICLSYKRMSEWLPGVCTNIPERVRMVLEQCTEVWRSIGNPEKGDVMSEDLRKLLKEDAAHFESALAIAKVMDGLKREIMEGFWSMVTDILKDNLRSHGHTSKWEAGKRDDWFGIFWLAQKPRFGVMVEKWHNEMPYYGINRSEPVKDQSRDKRDVDLSSRLVQDDFVVTDRWPGWRYIERSGYKMDIASLYRDTRDPNHPAAQGVAQLLWSLFKKYRSDLEDMNERYPENYPSMQQRQS